MTNQQISRRKVLIGGAGLAGAGFLAACQSNTGTDASGAKSNGGKKTEIAYWHVNTETFGLAAINKLVPGFNSSQDAVTVRAEFQPQVYSGVIANLQTALAAGNPPGLAQIGYLYSDYVKENFPFVSVTDLIKKYGPSDFLDQFPPNSVDLAKTSTGDQIGVPYAVSNPILYYNADMLKAAGLDPESPPKTWPDWRALALKYKDKTGKAMLYLQVLDDNWTNSALILSNGGSLTKCVDGSVKVAFADPPAVEAIQFWADLVKDGLCLNVPLDQGEQEFLAGQVACYVTTVGKQASFKKAANFDLRATSFPAFPGHNVKLAAGGNELIVFGKDEDQQQAAWEFIKYLMKPQSVTDWVTATGYLPSVKGDVLTNPQYLGDYFKKNPMAQVAEDQVANTIRWDYFPGRNGLEAGKKGFFSEGLQPALGGTMSARDSLSGAAKTVDGLIQGQKCAS